MPERAFLDKACSERFPLAFPSPDKIKFHLIAVARGSHEACRRFFNNQSIGSLVIDMALRGKDHYEDPFHIGRVLGDHFIHVLDEFALEVLLRELDTVTDFVRYLERREEFLGCEKPSINASGEEQITAIYLTHLNANNRHDFVLPEAEGDPPDVVYIGEGLWEDFARNPQYLAKKAADRVSYAWDHLIEHFIKHADPATMKESEPALRLLASESRFARRALSEQLIGSLQKEIPPGQRFARCGGSADDPERCYVFLVLPLPPFEATYEQYREARRNLLAAYCEVAKLILPHVRTVIGIASEPAGTNGSSEDLLAVDVGENSWSDEREQEAREAQEELGLFLESRRVMYKSSAVEFPDVPAAARGKLSPADRLRERERVRNLERLRHRRFTTKNRDPKRP